LVDPKDDIDESDPNQVLLVGCGFELGLGALALLLGWIFGPDPRATIPMLGQNEQVVRDTLIGAAAALPWLLNVAGLDRLPWKWIEQIRDSSLQIIETLKGVNVWGLAVLAASAGLGEELLFRGWLQSLLGGDPSQPSVLLAASAILAASMAFGLVHAVSRAYVLFAFCMGTFLGWLYFWSGSLLAPIVTHALYDFGALLLLRYHWKSEVS
jgi:uncharacterized protein